MSAGIMTSFLNLNRFCVLLEDRVTAGLGGALLEDRVMTVMVSCMLWESVCRVPLKGHLETSNFEILNFTNFRILRITNFEIHMSLRPRNLGYFGRPNPRVASVWP